MDKKEFYLSLSDEVKEKLKACKNEEEALKTLYEANVELPQELLSQISGGCGKRNDGEGEMPLKYWVIDGHAGGGGWC